MAEGFRNLIAWQKAYAFALEIYKETSAFPKHELYGVISQIRRAGISVALNISEGYERRHRKEYLRFLSIANGSLGEVETLLLFSSDLGYLNKEKYHNLNIKRQEIGKLLRGLINSLAEFSS